MTTKNGKPRDRNKAKGNGKATVPLTSLLNKRKSKEENPTCEKCGQKRYSRRVSDGEEQTKIYSRFCERHTCRAELPESLDQGFCPTPKSKKKHHCPDHSKCGRADCTEYGEYPNWELPFVCLNHQCRNEGCLNECIIHREWCGEHLCSRPNCGYPADTDRGVSLCVAHACRFPNCTNGAYDHNGLCPSHLPCTHQGCSAPRKPLEGNRARLHPFCVRHMPCEVDGCNNFAQERHKLCSYHSCHINNCTKQSEDRGSFCDDHTCHVSGCLSSIHNVVDPESRYCVYHCCRADDCLGEAVSNGGYCNEHVCLAHGCKRGRTERTTYCMEHNCKEPGCRYEAMVVGGYCRPLGHGCTEIGCRQRAIGGAQGVRQCEDHLIASVKRLGFDEAAEEYSARIDELQREVDDIRTQDPHEVTFDMPPVPPSPRYAMGYRVPYGVGFDMPPRSPNPGYAMRYREPHEVGFDLPPMPPSQSYATGYPDPVGYRPYRMVRPHFSETLAGPSRYDQYRPRGRQEFYE